MFNHFDTIAWLVGLGSWAFSVAGLFTLVSLFNLNPTLIVLSFPIPLVTVSALYALRLKMLPKLARQLGDLDINRRQDAFKQLMAMGQHAAEVFLEVLKAPHKKEEVANWNGLEATILAVKGLGQLKEKRAIPVLLGLLKTSERQICEAVIWALGEIGDNSIVPELLPFLGNEFLNGEAANSLRKLGADELVKLFNDALKRDRSAIEAIRKHPYRKAFVVGFIRALQSWEDISPIPNAAWALVELWATEAIPVLRVQVTRWLPTEIRQACKLALDKLETISGLPRPAIPSEIDTSTLPRPARASELTIENLPRVASFGQDDPDYEKR